MSSHSTIHTSTHLGDNKIMMYEVNQNGNDITVDRQVDHQMKTNATIVTSDGARLHGFLKVKIVFTDCYIGKILEHSSLMFPINPSTTNIGQHN